MDVTEEGQRIIDEYLAAVRTTLHGWSDADRDEICANLREHILEELAGRPAGQEEVASVLAVLGPPEQVADQRSEPAGRRRLGDLLLHPFSLGVAAGLVLFAAVMFSDFRVGILVGVICLMQVAAGLCGRRSLVRRGGSVPSAATPVVAAIGAVLALHVAGSALMACLLAEMLCRAATTLRNFHVMVITGSAVLGCFALLSTWCALGGKLPGRAAGA
jgi:hypothetical protein